MFHVKSYSRVNYLKIEFFSELTTLQIEIIINEYFPNVYSKDPIQKFLKS